MLSCSKNKIDSTCPDYEKGSVIAGIKNTASVEDVFSLCNRYGLQIDEMAGFFYTSPYPKDSLPGLVSYLDTKSYIDTRGFSGSAFVHYQTEIINVTTLFFDMNVSNQQDWINTKKLLKLVDTNGDTKDIVLKVPVGQEKYWLAALKQNKIVTWTELNCLNKMQLF